MALIEANFIGVVVNFVVVVVDIAVFVIVDVVFVKIVAVVLQVVTYHIINKINVILRQNKLRKKNRLRIIDPPPSKINSFKNMSC